MIAWRPSEGCAMAAGRKKTRWPRKGEGFEKGKQGIIDDRAIATDPYDLERWEILGEPKPEVEEATPHRRVSRASEWTFSRHVLRASVQTG